MESPKLVLYASAEGCNLKEFKGELTLKELIVNTNSNRYEESEHTEYSEPLDENITSKILQIEGLPMTRCIFSDGAELELMVGYSGKLRWMFNGFESVETVNDVIKYIRENK